MTYDEWLRDCLAIAAREKLTAAELDRMLSMHRDRPAASPTQQKDRLMTQDEKMLVPVEPTDAMVEAAYEHWLNKTGDAGRYVVRNIIKAALSAAPAQPAAVEGAEWLTDEDHAVIKRCVERQPKLCMRGQHEGYYVHSDIADLINMIGRARPSPPADDALRVAAIVAKNMADNASFNLNQAGLTIETAACDRAFVDIYRTLDAALKAGGVK